MKAKLITYLLIINYLFGNSQTTTISGVINVYSPVTQINSQTVVVPNANGFNVCDKVLIIQMKGVSISTLNTINYGNITSYGDAGNYEFGVISAVSANSIVLSASLTRSYTASGLVQLIRVPVYNNVNINGVLSCAAWNGTIGGVLAFEAIGNVILNGTIDASGKGFSGGNTIAGGSNCVGDTVNYVLSTPNFYGAQKGEGVFISSNLNNLSKGKNANGGGGGNDINGGGAGGSNFGYGGRGGSYTGPTSCPANYTMLCGGIGGQTLNYSNALNKVFLGGGGGAGHQNNGVATGGGNGGGIILMKAASIIGNNNSIISNGNDVSFITTIDGQGGGGAGGSILLDVPIISNCTVSVKGGYGGSDNWGGIDCHPKGGGGGGGIIWTSSNLLGITTVVAGGLPGTFLGVGSPCFGTSLGAAQGQNGGTLTGLSLPGIGNVGVLAVNSATICAGQSATLTATGANSYIWSNNLTGSSITVSPVATTIYTVNGSGSCLFNPIATTTVYVNPSSTLQVSGNNTICAGSSITLSASGATSYTWLPGNHTGSAIAVSPLSNTTYTLSGTSSCLLNNTIVKTVTVTPSSSITVNSTTICSGQSATLIATGGNTYLWSNNLSGASITVSPNVSTIYTVTASGLCLLNPTVTSSVVVNLTPTLSIAGNTLLCYGNSAILTVSGANSYSWSSGHAGANFTISPLITTTYAVTGFNTNKTCKADAVVTASVSECANLNRIGEISTFRVFPNPFNQEIEADFSDNINIKEITIFNTLGEIVYMFEPKEAIKSNPSRVSLNLSNLKNGIYLIKARTENETFCKRLIKE